MALAKLWNAFFGKRNDTPQETAPVDGPVAKTPPAPTVVKPAEKPASRVAAPQATALPASKPASVRLSAAVSSPVQSPANAASTVKSPAPLMAASPASTTAGAVMDQPKVPRKRGPGVKTGKKAYAKPVAEPMAEPESPAPVLRMFRRKNNSWSKLVGNRPVSVILDTNIGDGSRAVELLEAIVDSSTPTPKYVAIGMFELGDGKLTVRQFHQKVRAAGGQPIVIPMALEDGLKRLAQTIGTVDVLVWDGNHAIATEPTIAKLLQRVAPAGTLVLKSESGKWQASTPAKKAA